MNYSFPVFKAGHIFNDALWKNKIKKEQKYKHIKIFYPCRLDAMAINPAAVAYNDQMVFTPGEVVVSINLGLYIEIKLLHNKDNFLKISKTTKRAALVKHAHGLMKNIFGKLPAMYIDVNDDEILKHCGFGSSSSTIAGVCAAINELYNHPISNSLLIQYLASNHGEEVSETDKNNLKAVQCIGGGATGGLTSSGIIIIAGQATTIAKMKYNGKVIIAIPKDYKEKDAKTLMELEEENMWKFERTGNMYKDIIAYNLLHKALPDMANGLIKSLADVVYEYRFNMGSNQNCAFVYDGLEELSEKLKYLYTENHCQFLALSSVGPAFFAIVGSKQEEDFCKQAFESLNLQTKTTTIFNKKYTTLVKE